MRATFIVDYFVRTSVCRRRRAIDSDHFPRRPDIYCVRRIDDLIGIVKKNAIMQIDFALEAERKEGKSRRRSDL